jgi:hypothetical protein
MHDTCLLNVGVHRHAAGVGGGAQLQGMPTRVWCVLLGCRKRLCGVFLAADALAHAELAAVPVLHITGTRV